jgi:cytochrome c oxidase assembly protein Cox11
MEDVGPQKYHHHLTLERLHRNRKKSLGCQVLQGIETTGSVTCSYLGVGALPVPLCDALCSQNGRGFRPEDSRRSPSADKLRPKKTGEIQF